MNLQGWGDLVTTTGYGDLYSTEGINRWYTMNFSGTSNATPIVAGAVASLQGAARASGRGALSPSTVRKLLSGTGTPQPFTNTHHIGPLPDLRQALTALTTNLIDGSEFFIRQAYRDELKREPDAGGSAYQDPELDPASPGYNGGLHYPLLHELPATPTESGRVFLVVEQLELGR